ncbi:hypothetical protein JW964_14195 [candidate division KSB1 bacterium]|nr:hypothetical protein [candidate division KSB1 bacterium]
MINKLFRLIFVGIISLLLIDFSTSLFAQERDDKTERRKEEEKEEGQLKKFKERNKKEDKDGNSANNEGEDEDDESSCFLSELMFNLTFEFAKYLVAQRPDDPTRFMSFPYLASTGGFPVKFDNEYRRGFGQIGFNYEQVDENLNALGLSFRGRLHSRAGLYLDYSYFREELSNNRSDHLNLFRVGLIKSIYINQNLILDLDLGLRTVSEYGGLEIGLHSQFFPAKPFVLEFLGTIGSIDSDLFTQFDAKVGLLVNRFQLEGGYRILNWGDENLSGAIFGLKLWF